MFYVYCLHQDIQIQINFLNNVAYIQIYVQYTTVFIKRQIRHDVILFYFILNYLTYCIVYIYASTNLC